MTPLRSIGRRWLPWLLLLAIAGCATVAVKPVRKVSSAQVAASVKLLSPPMASPQAKKLAVTNRVVSLAWNASTDPTVVGYKIYWGTTNGVYFASTNVGNVTSRTLTIPIPFPVMGWVMTISASGTNAIQSTTNPLSGWAVYKGPLSFTNSTPDPTRFFRYAKMTVTLLDRVYLAATCYNSGGEESPFSNQVAMP